MSVFVDNLFSYLSFNDVQNIVERLYGDIVSADKMIIKQPCCDMKARRILLLEGVRLRALGACYPARNLC